jgi:hypothetical protein
MVKNMKIFVRNTLGILVIVILGSSLVAIILIVNSSPIRIERLGIGSGAGLDDYKDINKVPVQSRDECKASIRSDLTWKTKSKERPNSGELAKDRRERHRVETIGKLEKLRAEGIGERHPDVIQVVDDLKKVEADQNAVGEGGKP